MRSAIRQEAASISPMDTLEHAHQLDALAWIDSGAELCRLSKPATPPKHLVSYFVVIDGEHLLLIDHRMAQLWLPTGGHVEPGEHPRDAVTREFREELGVALEGSVGKPLMITCTTTVGQTVAHTDVSLWYVVSIARDTVFQIDDSEAASSRWFHHSEVPMERTDPHMGRFLRKLSPNKSLERSRDR
jgi:8-oxo-dGTP diphosphatase